MKTHLSPRQVARALGVSESSIKRWTDRGLLPAERTAGGHRRLPLAGIVGFLRENDHPLARPEILSLPAATAAAAADLEAGRTQLLDALLADDAERFRAAIVNLFLGGVPVAELCDSGVAPAFHRLGEMWAATDLEVYRERRAVEICLKGLHEIHRLLPPPPAGAPLALGATLEGDWYLLPSAMAETSLAEAGWEARSLGAGHPAATLTTALADHHPRLFWLSVSHVASPRSLRADLSELRDAARQVGAALVVGGRALDEALCREAGIALYGSGMQQLVDYARGLGPRPAAQAPSRTSASEGRNPGKETS